jgi:radical SAM/Cys-rich protein
VGASPQRVALPRAGSPSFEGKLAEAGLELGRQPIHTLQLNVTRLCNQACQHCHVDASPKRVEHMSRACLERCLELLAQPGFQVLDVTGGAPELYDHFDELVERARALGKRVMVRHNLTVTVDGDPRGASKAHLPRFFRDHGVEVVSSLPYYQPYFTDKQRGRGVFEKSMEALRQLNAEGIGTPGGLPLTLVYNPVGAFLPPAQAALEADFRSSLAQEHQVSFTSLIAITNMPIARFKDSLERRGGLEDYMAKLVGAFNPAAAEGVMCRSLISVDYDGRIYDCDFNQMLDLRIQDAERVGEALTVFELDLERLARIPIQFGSHCFGCTAGAGSSCGGSTA